MPVSRDEEDRQAQVRNWLESGAAFGGVRPSVIATHGNLLFLTDARVYKMKRAVDFDWMDFSTLARREAACRQEVALNRRTAPDLYLGMVAVTSADGGLALDGAGEPAEWLVAMRRFDESQRAVHLLTEAMLEPAHFIGLADDLAAFHQAAEVTPGHGDRDFVRGLVDGNHADFTGVSGLFDAEAVSALRRDCEARIEATGALIEERRTAGWVRRCHGDLHLANIVLWQGRLTPFDCIEFNEDFSCIDVLYDLAFLLMDLEHDGRRDLANLVLNRWLAMIPQPEVQVRGLALMPLFLSLRAAVRSKVAGLQQREAEGERQQVLRDEALGQLGRAAAYLRPAAPRLVAVGGLSGSGKSTLARALACRFGAAPGALHLRSDVLRKRLWGCRPEERLPEAAYNADWHRRVAATLLSLASQALEAGQSVVVDAVHAEEDVRAPLATLARQRGVPFDGLWLDAPPEVLKARVGGRSGDASDATAAVVDGQIARGPEIPTDWQRIDASGSPQAALTAALMRLGL